MSDPWLDAFQKAAAEQSTSVKMDPSRACCVFAHRQTELVYGSAACAVVPVSLWHLFADCRDAWAPVTAVVKAGLSVGSVLGYLPKGAWCRVQAWGAPEDVELVNAGQPVPPGHAGHTFTAWLDVENDYARILDSNYERGAILPLGAVVGWSSWSSQFHGLRAVQLRRV